MTDGITPLSLAIGTRIRDERLARRWTLDHLAETAGTSRRSLVNVEQGTANPSVGILLKLSDALGIGLPTLVAPPERPALEVTRAGQAPQLWSGELGGHGRLVAGTEPPDVVELWDWVMFPGEIHRSEAHVGGTRELAHVLDGAVTIFVGDESVVLQTGDAMSFRSDVAHSYAAHGDEPARFALSVYEPGVGTGQKDAAHA